MILFKMKKIIHRKEKCIGCSYCVEIAPEFWKMNVENGKCDLIGSKKIKKDFVLEIFEDELDKNERVAQLCPTNCIKIV
ncbi:ferredoxin [Marinifilum sp. N1E240]|nr:ferredoxin [Marinifilum sp. N1E240]